jgi:hypothetical protein
MSIPLIFGTPLRTVAIGLLANDWMHARDAELVKLQRIRICVGIALIAIGAFVAWERRKEKESVALPGFMGFVGANIALDAWKKIQRTYHRTIGKLM